MVTTRNRREDVVAAAGRLFAEHGYHGTSMRDLGKELGLLGSSLYAHVDSKQDLLVDVVAEGARLFQESARRADSGEGSSVDHLRRLVEGHVAVVLANHDVVRTFLNEARMLDDEHRSRVIAARDGYEQTFREVVKRGIEDGVFRADLDPKITTIFILSVLNALERWYQPGGELGPGDLADAVSSFVMTGMM